jgi:drug/metabolite transporter (DMT)-like permease
LTQAPDFSYLTNLLEVRPDGNKLAWLNRKINSWRMVFKSREEFGKGAAYMLLSSVTLSLFTLFAKFGADHTSFFLLLFLRFCIPLLLLIPFLLSTMSLKELFWIGNVKMQFLRSGCILLYQYSIFYYLTYASLLDATVLQNTAPLFMPILERIFFKHRFDKKVLLSIGISFVGVLCILQPDSDIFARLSVVGFLAPLGQAGSQVLYGHQAKKENQRFTLFYMFFLCSIFTGIIYVFSKGFFGGDPTLEKYSFWLWMNILFLGIVSILNQIFRGVAYQHGKASALAPFLYVSIIASAILDWAIFHHLPNWLSLVGAILVIVGGMIQIYRWKGAQNSA